MDGDAGTRARARVSSCLALNGSERGSVVDRETSVLKTDSEVIANAYARVPEIAARLLGHEPDGFRLKDASGKDLGVHSLSGIPGAPP
jgi:hypothetical protein